MSHRERISNPPQDSTGPKERLCGGTVQQPEAVQTEMVAFKIEGHGKVYRVKKGTILSEPSILCEMLATVESGGTLEEQAVTLRDVELQEFETLVHFYNEFGTHGIPAGITPFQYWERLKRVSRFYRITNVEERAYKELFDVLIEQNPVMAVVIAEHNPGANQEWLYAAYRKLCLRAKPLSDGEASRLHGATVNRITRAREKLRHWNSLSVARRGTISRDSIIREVFRIQGKAHKERDSR